MTPDVNILVAAFLPGHPQRAQALRWLSEALAASAAGATVAILPMVAVGFLRVVTGTRAGHPVTPIGQAVAFLKSIVHAPGVWMPSLGHEWNLFEALCLERSLRGGVITDAWIAAAVRTHGLRLVTFDADFRGLLRPDEYTLLIPENNVQESRVKYLVDYAGNRQALAA